MFLPASFRKILAEAGECRLVIRSDVFQKCLVLYPESVWNATLDELRSRLNAWNAQQQMMLRRFVADADVVELDSNGRILIGKNKLQYAGIEADVRFLAMDDRIEVWSKAALDALMTESDGLGAELESLLGN